MKYKLGEKHPTENLYRVVAIKDFGDVREGDIGGWVEGEHNLSHEGDCWVYDNVEVYGNAHVYGRAQVHGYAQVSGTVRVSGSVPQKKEWVGFTDEEISQYVLTADFVRRIEARLKEKNS